MKKFLAMVLALAMMLTMASAAMAETLKIGGIAPLTGAAASYGLEVQAGVNYAVEEINANGGLLGMQVEVIWRDDVHDPATSVNAYNEIVNDVVAFVGPVTTAPTIAVFNVAAQDGTPMITPSATAYEVTDGGNNLFRACFLDPYQAEIMAVFAKETLEASTAAIIYDNANDYTIGLTNSFKAKAAELGIEIVAEEVCVAGQADYSAQMSKIADAEPDVVYVAEYYEDTAVMLPLAYEAGLDETPLLGPDGWTGLAAQVGDEVEYLQNCYYSDSFSNEAEGEVAKAFVSGFTASTGAAPAGFNALGYDAARLMLHAIEVAGSTDAAAIVAALDATNYECATGVITFDDHNDPIKSVYVKSYNEDGSEKLVTRVDPQ